MIPCAVLYKTDDARCVVRVAGLGLCFLCCVALGLVANVVETLLATYIGGCVFNLDDDIVVIKAFAVEDEDVVSTLCFCAIGSVVVTTYVGVSRIVQ